MNRVELPQWLAPLVDLAGTIQPADFGPLLPAQPSSGERASAVLLLFWEDTSQGVPGDIRILLIRRASDMRNHAGQPAFPGGTVDPTDDGPVEAALREAVEETGLDPSGVEVLATLPELSLAVSGFAVTPVLAWWREPSPVRPVDRAEVASVHLVRVADLVDPANRLTVRHVSGRMSPAFDVDGLRVWGFTAYVLDRILHLAGWERPWDRDRAEEMS
ncbi:CoA pyrophosphatase [Sporichthya brevicatena]|uniref:CoA pyrophosphatase n=1 Tax=Sporichthya brevicatena TaxID=171442 RepID=A0ABP3R530_9ACTN